MTSPIATAPAVTDAAAPPIAPPSAALEGPRPLAFAHQRVLATNLPYGFGIAVDATHVYGVGYERGGAFRVPLVGGAAETLATGTDGARDLAVDETTLYWVGGHGLGPGGAVFAIPKAGGDVRELAPHQANPHVVTLDGAFVYWANDGGYGGGGGAEEAELRRMPKIGGAITTLARVAGVVRIVVAGDDLYVLASGASPYGLTGTVARMPKSGGALTVLAPSGPHPADLDLDETHLYWTSRGDLEMPPQPKCRTQTPCPAATTAPIVRHGELHRVPRVGGAPELLAGELRDAGALVVGRTSILFGAGGRLIERSKAGGAVTGRGEASPTRFAVARGEAFAFSGAELLVFDP